MLGGVAHQTTVATTNCGVFFSGARIGSPKRPLHSIPPAKTTNIVDSQHDRGCFRENACAPVKTIYTGCSMFGSVFHLSAAHKIVFYSDGF